MRIGVRDLKNQTTEIIRNVRENGTEYIITYYGRPVAILLPVQEEWLEEETKRAVAASTPGEEIWDELQGLRQEIGKDWQSEKTSVELLSEQRR